MGHDPLEQRGDALLGAVPPCGVIAMRLVHPRQQRRCVGAVGQQLPRRPQLFDLVEDDRPGRFQARLDLAARVLGRGLKGRAREPSGELRVGPVDRIGDPAWGGQLLPDIAQAQRMLFRQHAGDAVDHIQRASPSEGGLPWRLDTTLILHGGAVVQDRSEVLRNDGRSLRAFDHAVGDGDEIDRPAAPYGRNVLLRAHEAVVGPRIDLVVHGMDAGRRRAFGARLGDVQHADRRAILRHIPVLAVEKQQQPTLARTKPAPQIRRQVGAGDLRDEVERRRPARGIVGRGTQRPFDRLGHPGQAADPGPRRLLPPHRHLPAQHDRDGFDDRQWCGFGWHRRRFGVSERSAGVGCLRDRPRRSSATGTVGGLLLLMGNECSPAALQQD